MSSLSLNILDCRRDVYSQHGNDGIIEYIFKTIGIKKGVFVEFGAGDGRTGSNCRKLMEEGWDGLFIERDPLKYEKLKSEGLKCCNLQVGYDGDELFDKIIEKHLGCNIDFCSIDIDGLDLEIFETFEKYLPNVVCIEGGQALPPYHQKVDSFIASDNIQQSLSVMAETFASKGYELLGCHQDCFFVKRGFYNLFNVSSDLIELYLAGLKAQIHRLPHIKLLLAVHNLHNPIVDYVLDNSNYNKRLYPKDKRELWIKENREIILSNIDKAGEKYGLRIFCLLAQG